MLDLLKLTGEEVVTRERRAKGEQRRFKLVRIHIDGSVEEGL